MLSEKQIIINVKKHHNAKTLSKHFCSYGLFTIFHLIILRLLINLHIIDHTTDGGLSDRSG